MLFMAGSANAESELSSFKSNKGYCDRTDLDRLEPYSTGSSFTLGNTLVYRRNALSSRPTGVTIPPITSVRCHIEDNSTNKVLVSAIGENQYCGWVSQSDLLKALGEKTALEEMAFESGGVCGKVKPLTVKEYCDDLKKLGEETESCKDSHIRNTVFEAKFIVENTDLSRLEGVKKGINLVNVPVYSGYDSDDTIGVARIFTVLRVFGIKKKDKGTRFLVGPHNRKILGWMDKNSGYIWHSKLTTFYSKNNDSDVLMDVPSPSKRGRPLATRPKNLVDMLNSNKEFQRYPVLADRRKNTDPSLKNWQPHLEVAFIGADCGKDQLCSEVKASKSVPDTVILNEADVLFLIDGTKSMKKYFGLVAKSISAISGEFIDRIDYQFGVAMYGDFLDKRATKLTDDIQFKVTHPLKVIDDPEGFDDLINTQLFIKDAMRDKPEAVNAALYRAVQEVAWRGTSPKYVIHIGDHGDRTLPDSQLLKELWDSRIIYLPVAVQGDSINDASRAFVMGANALHTQYLTPKGNPMALPPNVTYKVSQLNNSSKTESDQAYENISAALLGAINLGHKTKNKNVDEAYNIQAPTVSGRGSISSYPPGYSALTATAKELFLGGVETNASLQTRTIAAQGFIQTAGLEGEEENWDHSVAIFPSDLRTLRYSFENLCVAIDDSDGSKDVQNAIVSVIEVLTGDKVSESEFKEYFSQKDKIPLSSQTLLGEGLKGLIRAMNNADASSKKMIKAYKKEVCRTATLLKVASSHNKLKNPYDEDKVVGGDLRWNSQGSTYSYKNAVAHDWVHRDQFERKTVFIPLSYLPGNPEKSSALAK